MRCFAIVWILVMEKNLSLCEAMVRTYFRNCSIFLIYIFLWVAVCSYWLLSIRVMLIIIQFFKMGYLNKKFSPYDVWACWICCQIWHPRMELTLNGNGRTFGFVIATYNSCLYSVDMRRFTPDNVIWMCSLILDLGISCLPCV